MVRKTTDFSQDGPSVRALTLKVEPFAAQDVVASASHPAAAVSTGAALSGVGAACSGGWPSGSGDAAGWQAASAKRPAASAAETFMAVSPRNISPRFT